MEIPIIVFILLFVLVVILLLLQRNNKKLADKISILEQTLDMKADAITSLKETYTSSRKALDQHAAQIHEITDKKLKLINFQDNKVSLEETIRDKNSLLKRQQEIYEQNLKDSRNAIESMKKEAIVQNNTIHKLKQTHEAVMHETNKKHFELEDSINLKTNKNRELASLLSKTIGEAKEEKQKLKTVIHNNNKKIEMVKKEYKRSQQESHTNYAQYEAKITSKEGEMSNLNKTFNELAEELKENIFKLENQVLSEKGTINELKEKHTTTVQSHNENIMTLTSDLGKRKVHSDKLKVELKEDRKMIQNKQNEIVNLEEQNRDYGKKVTSLKKTLMSKMDAYDNLQLTLDKVNQKSQKDKEVFKQTVLDKSKNISKLKVNLIKLEETIIVKKDKISTLEMKHAETTQIHHNNIARLDEEISQVKQMLKSEELKHGKRLRIHEEKHNEDHHTMQVQTKKIESLEKKNHKYMLNITSLEETKVLKEHKYGKLKDETVKLGHTIQAKIKENTNISTELAQTKLAYKNEYDARKKTLEIHVKEIATLKANYKISQDKAVLAQEQTKREIVQLHSLRDELTKEKNEQIVLINKALMKKDQEVTTLLDRYEGKEEKQTKELHTLRTQIEVFKQKNAHYSMSHQTELDDSKILYATLKKNSEAKEKDLLDAYKEIEREFQNHKKELESRVLKKEEDILELMGSRKTIEALHQKELGTLQLSLSQKENTSTSLMRTHQNSVDDLQEKILFLEKTIETKEDIIYELTIEKGHATSSSTQSMVMQSLRAGESKKEVAKKLDIPLKRIELIVKFDKIQHKNQNAS